MTILPLMGETGFFPGPCKALLVVGGWALMWSCPRLQSPSHLTVWWYRGGLCLEDAVSGCA